MTHASRSGSTDHRLPLHARIKDDLLRRVQSGEWPTDVPLPPEAELASSYDSSVGTMRRVLSELTAEGMLLRQQGRGTFVRRASFENSLFRFFRVQGDAEVQPASRILDRTTEPAGPQQAEALGIKTGSDVLRIQRLRLWGERPFLSERIWLPLPEFREVAMASETELAPLLYPAYERLAGVSVGRASEELSVAEADEPLAELLQVAAGSPLVRITRIATTHAGDIVEYRESFGPADTFRYRVEIN
ncbi:GntR family transcriptional regulator [Arthrobacter sp.]|uniref:GntR family transcriptional regulator n=1 Tax=Arthrobacter sp. TaxID=1667 RepID=UPI003A8EE0C9